MKQTTIINRHIICKCSKDLGVVEDSKGYLCDNCEIIYFTNENSIKLLDEINDKKIPKSNWNVLDWLDHLGTDSKGVL